MSWDPHAPIPDGWNKVHNIRAECVECGQVKPDCNGSGTCWECASTRDVPGVDSPMTVEMFDALYDALKEERGESDRN